MFCSYSEALFYTFVDTCLQPIFTHGGITYLSGSCGRDPDSCKQSGKVNILSITEFPSCYIAPCFKDVTSYGKICMSIELIPSRWGLILEERSSEVGCYCFYLDQNIITSNAMADGRIIQIKDRLSSWMCETYCEGTLPLYLHVRSITTSRNGITRLDSSKCLLETVNRGTPPSLASFIRIPHGEYPH